MHAFRYPPAAGLSRKRARKRIVHRLDSYRVGSRSFIGEVPNGRYNWAIVGWQVVTSSPRARTRLDKSKIDPRLDRELAYLRTYKPLGLSS